jgi:hypothetical protein
MNKHMIAAASAAVMVLAATTATAEPIGHVDVAYSDSNDADSHAFSGGGAVVFPTGPVNVEIDASGATTHTTGFGSEKSFDATGHVFFRNDRFAAGAFVSGADEGLYAWGGEGAVYLDRVTLSAQVGQLRDESKGGFGELGTAAGVSGKVFITDNISVGADYANFNPKGSGGSLDVWGVNGEVRFANTPVSAFLAYQKNDDFDVSAWTIGGRWHFGAGSLKEQDRKGASMGGSSLLTTF